MGVLQMAVHPGLGTLGKLRRQLARRQHRLAVAVGQPVAVHVHVVELVVEPDLLDLAEGPKERTVVPEPDVADGVAVVGEVAHRKARLGRIVAFGNAVDAEGPAGEGDVVLKVGPLASELVRIDIDRMDRRRKDAQQDDVRADRAANTPDYQPQVAAPHGHHRQRRDRECDRGHQPERRHHHVHLDIAGTPDGALRGVEQPEAIEDVSGGLRERQCGEVAAERHRRRAPRRVVEPPPIAEHPSPTPSPAWATSSASATKKTPRTIASSSGSRNT